jgi:ATP-binding cassette subfamily F protein 3
MPLVECIELHKDWSGTSIIESATFSIQPGEKVGMVGRNGCGKTSLLRILEGSDQDYRGLVRRSLGLSIALVEQRFEPPAGKSCVETLLEETEKIRARIAVLEENLSSATALDAYGVLTAKYAAAGGELAEEGARRLLGRAGLASVADAPAAALSGGEKNVLGLARMDGPDLLLLDEPGNHLDFAGLAWLEEFIRGERRAILMVSHNRQLLDRSVDRILELEDTRISAYAGGWSSYRLEKLRKAAAQGKDWQADRKKIERLEALVRRFADIARARPDPAWGKRLRARRHQLERERAAAAERPDLGGKKMRVAFGESSTKSDYALIVKGYSKAYGARLLIEGAELDLLAGERAALVGPNGSGKTSFIRDLVAAEGRWDEGGSIRVGPSMRIGYCAQEQEVFQGDLSVIAEFEALGGRADEVWKLLRRYLFDRSVLDMAVRDLSGGERNRLQIARAVFLGATFLVLDEPTNHLDIEGREALEEGLSEYGGTILAVSHDRWFLEKVAERIVLLEEGRFVPYEGSFAEYWRDLGAPRAGIKSGIEGRGRAVAAGAGGSRHAKATQSLPSSSPAALGGTRARAIEDRITSLEKRREELERVSAAATADRDFARAGRAAGDAAAAARLLEGLYSELQEIS